MKTLYFLLVFILLINRNVIAQNISEYQPLNYQFYQKLDPQVYNIHSKFHSAIKPYFSNDSILVKHLDSLTNRKLKASNETWLKRKLFNEHLIDIKKTDYTFYADFLPDFQIGYDRDAKKNTWLNTRGYQFGGTIGNKFSFYTSGYENQAHLPDYLLDYVNQNGIIPGQVNDKFGPIKSIKDWAYATSILSYTPTKYLNISLGQDKNFIGDGYRSMLLSDVSANYPFLKLTANLGNVKYMAMWAQFEDLKSPQLSYDNGYRKKWGVFHYADWNVNDKLSLGFFEAIIWQDADSTGKRGFDASYINPFIFLRPVEGQNGSPDNALIGFNAHYELFPKMTLYGQFLLDEFTAKEVFAGTGYWANKFAYQLGIRGSDILHIKNFNYLLEFNTARPYTYSQRTTLLNYGNYNQALAHPFGANFREWIGILNYSLGRIELTSKLNIAQYGLDNANTNFGKDIFKSYISRNSNYNNKTTQGISTTLLYSDTKASYLINPKTNLRLELGLIARKESNSNFNNKTTWVTFGLRSSFRNIYYDF